MRYLVSGCRIPKIWPYGLAGLTAALKYAHDVSTKIDGPVRLSINGDGTTALLRVYQAGAQTWAAEPSDE